MQAALGSDELRVHQIVPGSRNRNLGGKRHEVNLDSPEAIGELHRELAGSQGAAVGALINLLGLTERFNNSGNDPSVAARRLAQEVFNVVKEFEGDLRASAQRGGGWLLNFTSLDGKFGLGGNGPLQVAQAATLGIFKTLAKEWPETFVKNLDVDPRMDPQLLFSLVAEEIIHDDGLVEIGIAENKRWKPALVFDSAPRESNRPVRLDEQSVVLVTGGAYGITAEVIKELARACRPRLVLVGRSPLPEPEPAELRNLHDAAALKRHFIETMRRRRPDILPAEIEREVRRVLKERQIRDNLAAMEQTAHSVDYHAASVRDPRRFGAVLDEVYARYGRLDGVIHGAGVIEDGLVGRKTPESFDRVFGTKVDGAGVLVDKLRSETLQFLAFFSSVSGRFGNPGQIDYAAANDYLNKLAVHLDAQWPGRVFSVNWGPWDAGMISDELRRMYESVGVRLIPPRAGAKWLLDELARTEDARPEVLLACTLRTIAAGGRGERNVN